MKKILFLLALIGVSYGASAQDEILNGNLKFVSEYNEILWPVNPNPDHPYGGGITGDDFTWKRLTLFHGHSIDLQTGSNTVDSKKSRLYINTAGNVGIGTRNPDAKLTVAGNVNARQVKVTVNAGADFVFEPDYQLPSLNAIEAYVKEHKHLPEIASEEAMKENGLDLGSFQIQLLQKIEELTLHMIQQDKQIKALKANQSK